jgi:hypothetical protein
LHHEKFSVNYGTLGFLDWLHGTTISARDQGSVSKQKVNVSKAFGNEVEGVHKVGGSQCENEP